MATINGTAASEILNSGAASDRLNGLGGHDTLNGGGGNDTLDGGTGHDHLVGGSGNDFYIASAEARGDSFIESQNGGTDTVLASISFSLGSLQNIENLTLTSGEDLDGSGNAADNAITGNDGDNTLDGRDGNDTLKGHAGEDVLVGRAGNDVLDGGAGDDALLGGSGRDVLVWDAADDVVNGGAGQDTLQVRGQNKTLDLAEIGSQVRNVEVIDITGTGNNTLILSESAVVGLSGTSNTLRVDGNSGDAIASEELWSFEGNVSIGEQVYATYRNGSALLQVDTDIDRAGLANLSLSALHGINGFRLDGIGASDRSGSWVATAGDVNHDGFADLMIGAPRAEGESASYVVFGDSSIASSIDLGALNGMNGFRLAGRPNDASAYGTSGASAGDVNGDGFADLIIGASGADPGGRYQAGESYVVFGGSGFSASMSLGGLNGSNGFRLEGIGENDLSGLSVASAGDINGDGFADLIIGANSYEGPASPHMNAGESYVVFGGSSFSSSVDLAALDGTDGFRLDGEARWDRSGWSVASAGDINGDGYADLVIGGFSVSPGLPSTAGQTHVVFGASTFTSSMELGALNGTNGFWLNGIDTYDASGASVAAAGDVNGDGYADFIISAQSAGPGTGVGPGESYVVFGRSTFGSTFDLESLNGANGFRLDGASGQVASAGDVNGDGYEDLIVGDQTAHGDGAYAGAAYVVFGGTGFFSSLDLTALNGENGFRLDGTGASHSGQVSSAGDVNGDGFSDLVIGAPGGDGGAIDSGQSYVVYGGNFSGAVNFRGGAVADSLTGTSAAEAFVAGRGNDTMIGNGGADVFRGGAGDDRIVIASDFFFDIDGGTGKDTLALAGSGFQLDLTGIGGDGKTTGIEVVDLVAGSGEHSLKLSLTDLLNLSDTSNTLTVKGDGADAVEVTTGEWTDDGIEGNYHVYTLGAATLKVHTTITDVVIDT